MYIHFIPDKGFSMKSKKLLWYRLCCRQHNVLFSNFAYFFSWNKPKWLNNLCSRLSRTRTRDEVVLHLAQQMALIKHFKKTGCKGINAMVYPWKYLDSWEPRQSIASERISNYTRYSIHFTYEFLEELSCSSLWWLAIYYICIDNVKWQM